MPPPTKEQLEKLQIWEKSIIEVIKNLIDEGRFTEREIKVGLYHELKADRRDPVTGNVIWDPVIGNHTIGLRGKFADPDLPRGIVLNEIKKLYNYVISENRAKAVSVGALRFDPAEDAAIKQKVGAMHGVNIDDLFRARRRGTLTPHEIEILNEYEKEKKEYRDKKKKAGLKTEAENQYALLVNDFYNRYNKADMNKILTTPHEQLSENDKKIKHEFRKEFGKVKEGMGKQFGVNIPKIKIPKVAKKAFLETERIFGSFVMVVIGFVISAMLGLGFLFTLAFLCFAAYVIIPGSPEYMRSTLKNMQKIKDKYEKRIHELEEKGEFEKAVENSQLMENEINAEKSLGKWGKKEIATRPYAYATVGIKQVFKMLGLIFILISIGFSNIPMAKIIAIIGGFIAYFSFEPSRIIAEKKEED